MLQFSLTKKILIWGVCALGIFMAMPNLFYTQVELSNDAEARIEAAGNLATPELQTAADSWPSFLPSSLVNLGLDLRGGAHLLAEVHVEEVYTDVDPALHPLAAYSVAAHLRKLVVEDRATFDGAADELWGALVHLIGAPS